MGGKFTVINESFDCIHCGCLVQPLRSGGCRNHCPECFYSLHLDIYPGDRKSDCKGILIPIRADYHSKKGYMIVHRCETCGHETRNKLTLENEEQPDSQIRLHELLKYPII